MTPSDGVAGEHGTWAKLYGYVAPRAATWACRAFLDGLQALSYEVAVPPDLVALEAQVYAATGWRILQVEGEVPSREFFAQLADRCFPVARRLRPRTELFATADADLWHDAFGHVPLLFDADIRALYVTLGELGVRARDEAEFLRVCKLYWFLGEYGVLVQNRELRVFGAALLAAPMTSERWQRRVYDLQPFDLGRVLAADAEPHALQRRLFFCGDLQRIRHMLVEAL